MEDENMEIDKKNLEIITQGERVLQVMQIPQVVWEVEGEDTHTTHGRQPTGGFAENNVDQMGTSSTELIGSERHEPRDYDMDEVDN